MQCACSVHVVRCVYTEHTQCGWAQLAEQLQHRHHACTRHVRIVYRPEEKRSPPRSLMGACGSGAGAWAGAVGPRGRAVVCRPGVVAR